MAWFRMMGNESVEYHRKTVLGREDDHPGRALAYYGTRGETPLEWGGQLAGRLSLEGAVEHDEYSAIFGVEGPMDPVGGWRLARVTRPGVELVVAAHKSVAVLGVIGRADDMHAILDAETDATLAFIEGWFERQGGRRGRAQSRTATGGLLWARTRHATSRAGDPNPHDHVLIANLTEMLDARGGWKGLDTAALRDVVHAATMAGRVASAATAVRLGYAITEDTGPSGRLDHWKIDGIPDAVTAVFSKRSADIDAAVETTGVDTPQARAVAARTTRRAKQHDDLDSLSARWLGELEAIGWPARKLHQRLEHVTRRSRPTLRTLAVGERADLADQVIGPSGPLAQLKTFTRNDVIRAAAPALYGCEPEELDRVVGSVVSHPETVPLLGQSGARSRAWVAASVVAIEGAVADVAARMAAATTAAAVGEASLQQALTAKEQALGAKLTPAQSAAVGAVATSGAGLDLVVGVAGAGKTTALEVARVAFEGEGYRVLGAATSGQAARALRDEAGVDSRTIASLVWRLETGTLRLDDRTVIFIDEVGMTSDRDLLEVLVAAEAATAKVVAIGDHHQLSAVTPGGGLEALASRHPRRVHVLDQNVRQRDPAERAALAMLRSGSVETAVDWYRSQDRIELQTTRDGTLDAAVAAWAADRADERDTILLAWRRRDVAALNLRARQHLLSAGEISGPDVGSPSGRRYAAGDRVVTLAPDRDRRFVTSQRGTLTDVGADSATVRFDDGSVHSLSGDDFSNERLDYAYAVTVHRTQGATVDTVHLYADGGGRELAYVAMSRARISTTVHVVADDLEQAARDLTSDWSMDRRDRWTLDVDTPLEEGTPPRPGPIRRIDDITRQARIRAERDAAASVGCLDDQTQKRLELRERLAALSSPTHRRPRGRGLGL